MPRNMKPGSEKIQLNLTFRHSKKQLIAWIGILLATISLSLYFGNRIIRLNTIADETKTIINKWNNLDKNINDILFMHFNTELDSYQNLVRIKSLWAYQTIDFSYSLNQLKDSVEENMSPDSIEKMNDAYSLWILTKRNLQLAQTTLEKILSREYENLESLGLLHFYYRYRNTETMSFDSTVDMMNFQNEISILDVSGNDFSNIMNSTARNLRVEIEKQIRIIILLLVLLLIVMISLLIRLNSLINRSVKLESEKRELKLRARSSILNEHLFNENAGEQNFIDLEGISGDLDLLKPMALIFIRPIWNSTKTKESSQPHPLKNELITSLNAIVINMTGNFISFFHKDDIVVIINHQSDDKTDLQDMVETIHKDYSEVTSLKTLCIYSHPIEDYTHVAEHFHKVISASVYRFVQGNDSIINANMIDHLNPDDFDYPIKTEQLINRLIREGKIEPAEQEFDKIINEVKKFSFLVVKMTSLRLISSMMNTLQIIITNNCLTSLISRLHEDYEIIHLETLDEIRARIFALIHEVNTQIEHMNSQKHDSLIEKIDNEILNDFNNPNLSVESLADIVKLSPIYLGRIYKKRSSRSISDAINDKRLQESCSMLMEGSHSVNEICKSIGFSNESYFYTLFKKKFGVTPSRYRKSSEQN